MGALAGATLPLARRVLLGSDDPFGDGWPVFLNLAAAIAALAMGYWLRSPFIAAFGLYAGMLTYLFAQGGSEYPVSSCIALAVHGLAPALVGAGVALLLLTARRPSRIERA